MDSFMKMKFNFFGFGFKEYILEFMFVIEFFNNYIRYVIF